MSFILVVFFIIFIYVFYYNKPPIEIPKTLAEAEACLPAGRDSQPTADGPQGQNFCGVCWTKFECFSSKIQMIKNTNADEAGRNNLSGGMDPPRLG
jgi:hypothetical protein